MKGPDEYPVAVSCWAFKSLDAHVGEAQEPDDQYQAVGLRYGQDSLDAAQGAPDVDSFDPGFDIPLEHGHAMRGMTEQQHKVIYS